MIRRCRLGKDPEEKVIRDDLMVVNAPVAESHFGKNKKTGEYEQKGSSWYDVAIFGDPSEDNPDDPAIRFAELRKGDMIEIYDGVIRQEIYENKEGKKVYTYKFIVNNFNIIKLYEADDE